MSIFLIRLSQIIGGLFILIDTYWINEKRIWQLRNKSWILSGSFHSWEEYEPAKEKSFHSYKSLFGDLLCFLLESELSVINNMNFLLRCSENISFWLHMLTFSLLKMWVSKWPFTFLLQEGALSHSPEELFICWFVHSLEFLEAQREWGLFAIGRFNSLVSSVLDTSRGTVMTVTRPSFQGEYSLNRHKVLYSIFLVGDGSRLSTCVCCRGSPGLCLFWNIIKSRKFVTNI